MFDQERFDLELKESVSKTFLKTVSAYSNYHDGRIVFGVTDRGQIVGLPSVKEDMARIENMINDSILPRPTFKMKIENHGGKQLLILDVRQGKDTPYYYKGHAYRRSDTSTAAVGREELKRLVLGGLNINYEATASDQQAIEFTVLESKMKEALGIEALSLDVIKTLELCGLDGKFRIAALLLGDRNESNLPGIDLIRFGKSINQILFRGTAAGVSLLSQYDYAVEIFERYYQYEEIIGFTRQEKQVIPKEAFREAVANALVHREWDVQGHIQIAMYDDRIEINSPGGLPFGMSEVNYLNEQLSIPRNPIIAGVFHRLGLIERFGTGIARIKDAYQASYRKPGFEIGEGNIKVILPVFQEAMPSLSQEEYQIYQIIREGGQMTRSELDQAAGFNKYKTIRTLNGLLEKEIILKYGQGPGTSYGLEGKR